MALQIRRGTNVQRLLYTPLIGEMVFVTDYQTAGSDPIYVGDGFTPGGVAVGQNAVLQGNVEGDINLNGFDISGTGDISTTGNISNLGDMQTRKITITGNGGVAVVSTGTITNTGDVNITGNVLVDGNVEAINVTSDLVGSVLSGDSTVVLVNAINNTFSGESIALSGGANVSTLTGSGLVFEPSDPTDNYTYGTEAVPFASATYSQRALRHFGKLIGTGAGANFPGISSYTTYRGTLASPLTITAGDRLQGTLVRSYNTANGSNSAFAGGIVWVAEDQTNADAGVVPSTLVLGSGLDFSQAVFVTNTETSDSNNALKYTSKGVLKVTSIDLRALDDAERTTLTPNLSNGSIIYNYDAIVGWTGPGSPIKAPRLQMLANGVWYNIDMSGIPGEP